MVKHTQRNVIFVIFGIVIIGSMVFLFQQDASGEFEIRLPPPAQLTDAGFEPIEAPFGSAVPTGINCKVKQTTIVVGQRGNTIGEIDRLESGGLQGSPFALTFTFSLQDEEVSHFQVEPKIFCSEANGLPIEVFVKRIQVLTVGKYLGTSQVIDTENIFGSRLLNFGQGQGEQRIEQFIITAVDLESGLPIQNFPATYEFHVTGTLNVQYRDFPQIVYQIPILFGELQTSYIVNILKDPFDFTCPDGTVVQDSADCVIQPPPRDTDGDGILDIVDQCPNQPEDFDGFEDGDGCPESGSPIINPTPEEPTSLTCQATGDAKLCKLECEQGGGKWTIVNNSKPFCVTGGDIGTVDTPTTGTTSEEDFLSGQLKSLIDINYVDNSFVRINGDFSGDSITIRSGDIIPTLTLAGSTGLDEGEKELKSIEYALVYIFPDPNIARTISLTDSDLFVDLDVIVSSVQSESLQNIPLRDFELRASSEIIQGSGQLSIGTGLILGETLITSKTIESLAEQSGVTVGQLVGITIKVTTKGEFALQQGSTQQRFSVTKDNTFFELSGFTFDNNVVPIIGGADSCPSNTVAILNNDGELLRCDPLEVDTRTCRTPERPQGFNCSQSFIDLFCPNGNTSICIEPDRDRDGFVDILDNCPNTFATGNEGCPQGQQTDQECDSIREGICVLGEIIIIDGGGKNDGVCSILNPQLCNNQSPFNLASQTNLLIFGGILFIIIGVAVFIARRR